MSTAQWLLMFHITGAFFLVGGSVAAGVLNVLSVRAPRPSETALYLRLIRTVLAGDRHRIHRDARVRALARARARFRVLELLDHRRARALGRLGRARRRRRQAPGARPREVPSSSRPRATRPTTNCARSSATPRAGHVAARRARHAAAARRHDLEAGPVIALQPPASGRSSCTCSARWCSSAAILAVLVLALAAWRRPDEPPCGEARSGRCSSVAIPSWILMRVGAQWIYSKENDIYPTTRPGSESASSSRMPGCSILLITTGVAFWWNRRGGRSPVGS